MEINHKDTKNTKVGCINPLETFVPSCLRKMLI